LPSFYYEDRSGRVVSQSFGQLKKALPYPVSAAGTGHLWN